MICKIVILSLIFLVLVPGYRYLGVSASFGVIFCFTHYSRRTNKIISEKDIFLTESSRKTTEIGLPIGNRLRFSILGMIKLFGNNLRFLSIIRKKVHPQTCVFPDCWVDFEGRKKFFRFELAKLTKVHKIMENFQLIRKKFSLLQPL